MIPVSSPKNTYNLFGNIMDPVYAEVGAEVVIAFHRQELYTISRPVVYVGRKTVIIRVGDNDCGVRADGGYYWWPVRDMILASDIDLLTPEQKLKIKP